jgi:hypothetical protein
MAHDLEVRIGRRIESVLVRIRSRVSLMGMAGKWHVGKASDVFQDRGFLERFVVPLGQSAEAKYLEGLPVLIAQTREQDRRCEAYWDASKGVQDRTGYLAEREKLVELLPRFEFRLKLYELLVRQPEKPLLRDAIRLLEAGQESTPEAMAIEAIVRMRLREFIALEEKLAEDFRDLDEARRELWSAHEDLAREIAGSQPRSDPSTVSSALVGLRRAAAWYDYKGGYSFAEYARHWIQEAIRKRRG